MSDRKEKSHEHQRNIVQTTLTPSLLASEPLGAWIVIDDRWLWATAASHAYGLSAFVVLDLILAIGVVELPKLAFPAVLVVSITQVGAMVADALAYVPTGVGHAASDRIC